MNSYWGGEFLLITLVGTGVGFLAGVFGVGGGFLIVPVLNIALGMPMEIAVGSTACQMLGPATTSILARRLRSDDLKLPLIIAGGLFAGAITGAEVLHLLTEPSSTTAVSTTTTTLPSGELVVLAVYLFLLMAMGLFSIWESSRELAQQPIRTGWLLGVRAGPVAQIGEYDGRRMSIVVIAWFGLFVGFLSGLLGIGGAFLLLPGLIYLLGLEWHRAVTTSMLMVWIVAVQATIAHSLHDHIRLPVVIALLLGGTLGARVGVEWSRGLPAVYGRRSFGWLALAAAGMIALKLAISSA